MRHVRKGGQPRELLDWQAANKLIPENLFYGEAGFPKDAVKQALLGEQFHLCAYTMIALDGPGDCHIEHILPQWLHPNKSIDYGNMLACYPKEAMRENAFGAMKKGGVDVAGADFVSPLHASCETQFSYRPNGTVTGNSPAADQTIKLLALDHDRLNQLREAQIRGYGFSLRGKFPVSAAEARRQAANVLKSDSNDRLPAFCVAIAQVALKYASAKEGRGASFASRQP